jgi:hypothetical protein
VRRRAALALVGLVLAGGCATGGGLGPRALKLGAEPYGVGTLTIWIRPQAEVNVLCHMADPKLPPSVHVLGCYIVETQTIVSTDDAWVLMHELKHFFEGRWHD